MDDMKSNDSDAPASEAGGGDDAAMNAHAMPQSVDDLEELLSPRLAEQKRLMDAQTNARGCTERLTYEALGTLILPLDVAQGIIADVFHRLDGKAWPYEGEILTRHVLLASFASSMLLTEVITLQGLYVPAATLVRQQMECVAQLDAIESGKSRRKDMTAHLGALRWKLAKANGSLSDIAHNDPIKLRQLLADQHAVAPDSDLPAPAGEADRQSGNISVYPRFIEWKARQLLSQQACFALISAAHALCFMQDVSSELISEDDAALIQYLSRALEMHGIVEPANRSA